MVDTCRDINGNIKTLNTKVKTLTFNSTRNDEKFAEEIDTEVNKFIKHVKENNGSIHDIKIVPVAAEGFHVNYGIFYNIWEPKKEPKTRKTTKKNK